MSIEDGLEVSVARRMDCTLSAWDKEREKSRRIRDLAKATGSDSLVWSVMSIPVYSCLALTEVE